MYSDLFDQLGRGVVGGGAGGRSGTAAEPPEEPPLLSCKAGKMLLISSSSSEQQQQQRYSCTADPARGEIRLVWKDDDDDDTAGVLNNINNNNNSAAPGGQLEWQWYDRRLKKVQDRFPVRNNGGSVRSTFARVPLADKLHANDRVYVWSCYPTSNDNDNNDTPPAVEHRMYWMQDAEMGDEEQLVQTINEYLQDPSKAAPEGFTAGRAGSNNNNNAASSSSHQVDALSSILENLGMPQTGEGGSDATGSTASNGANSNINSMQAVGGGGLTLADLQGAMAGIAAASSNSSNYNNNVGGPGPPLNDVLTAQAIDSLLANDEVVQRLLPLLPEPQQSAEHLRDNLLSPQMRNTVSALQQALLPDDAGDLSGYASVIANFQLDPMDGQDQLAQGNPLAAFLECVIASVEREAKEEVQQDEGNAMEQGDGDDKEEEEKDGEAA